jgi:hypothetical protein
MKHAAALFCAIGVCLLVALFVHLRPVETGTQPVMIAVPPTHANAAAVSENSAAVVGASPTAVTPQAARIHRHAWVIHNVQHIEGPKLVHLRQGEEVQLQITSDRDDELHLHGYDLHQLVRANVPTTLTFTARHAGRFSLELHGSHLDLGTLEVAPQ